jgi:hypothetical protein
LNKNITYRPKIAHISLKQYHLIMTVLTLKSLLKIGFRENNFQQECNALAQYVSHV